MTREELYQELISLKTRGEIKRFAQKIQKNTQFQIIFNDVMDSSGRVDTKAPIKKQIRMYLDRSSAAQIRTNPIFVDESFVCGHCGKDVPIGDVMIRDHCPFCLWGRHLDNIPGDRAADCGGLMKPLSFSVLGGTRWIHYECTKCSHQFRVRAHPDDTLEL
tara:strand:- start:322 stop:804 length:483 start_codon:yes stop_codon:yes gene_type:complete